MDFVSPQNRIETECTCLVCKLMCIHSPCFPTPEQVEKLIAAGHKDKLKITLWGNVQTADAYLLIAPENTDRGCVFQDLKGLCTLHASGLKPIEGKLASHNMTDNGLRQWVCEQWISEKGLEIMKLFTDEPGELNFIKEKIARKNAQLEAKAY